MRIFYEEGPERLNMGAAGVFRRGEPKTVQDTIAEALLKKQTVKFHVMPESQQADRKRKKEDK